MTTTYNPDQQDEQRLKLMEAFKQRLGDVSSHTWALLWLADLDKLEQLLASSSDDLVLKTFFFGYDSHAKLAVKCKLIFFLDSCIHD